MTTPDDACAIISQGDGEPPGYKSERRWVLWFSTLVMLATTLPYLAGYTSQGEDWRFTGFVFGVEDGNSYIAKMLGGSAGEWLFRTPYTASPQRGVLIFLPYLLLGKLAAPPGQHEQLVALYHLFRLSAGFLAILATYDFLSLFIKEIKWKRFGLALAVLGGGLGWILMVLGLDRWMGALPLEFYSPESFGFLGLFGIPHLALARAMLLWGIVVFARTAWLLVNQTVSFRQVAKIGGIWLLTSLVQPLNGMVIGAVIGVYLISLAAWQSWRCWKNQNTDWLRWRKAAKVAILASVFPAPFIIYNILSFRLDPFLRTWIAQNNIPSPHFFHYLIAFGLVIPFAWCGGEKLLSRDAWRGWLPVAWVLALPILAYAPFSLQRRLPEGIWVALVTLTVAGIEGFGDRKLKFGKLGGFRLKATSLFLVILYPSTVTLLWGGLITAIKVGEPLFHRVDEVRMFGFLEKEASPREVVLTSFETGNALPAWSPQRVVIGHGPESADDLTNRKRVAAFFSSETSDQMRLALIEDFSASYVIWGPNERELGKWDPKQEAYLVLVYQQGEYEVFRVNPPDSTIP